MRAENFSSPESKAPEDPKGFAGSIVARLFVLLNGFFFKADGPFGFSFPIYGFEGMAMFT